MMKISKRANIRMPTVAEDKAITAAARNAPDARPLTPKQLKTLRCRQPKVDIGAELLSVGA
jgi:hypothetical protein